MIHQNDTRLSIFQAAPSTELTPAMSLELLTTATGTLRREYMARLEVARAELLRRAAELGERRAEQERLLQRLERERIKARDEAEALSERYEDVKDRGQELGARVEATQLPSTFLKDVILRRLFYSNIFMYIP